jgi:hypothetical protein
MLDTKSKNPGAKNRGVGQPMKGGYAAQLSSTSYWTIVGVLEKRGQDKYLLGTKPDIKGIHLPGPQGIKTITPLLHSSCLFILSEKGAPCNDAARFSTISQRIRRPCSEKWFFCAISTSDKGRAKYGSVFK